jgi:2-dehydropantoate 2-reductase
MATILFKSFKNTNNNDSSHCFNERTKKVKIAIYGAGAIGGWIGARVGAIDGAKGHEMSVIARGANLAALKARGLRLLQNTGEEIRVAVKASDKPDELGIQDLIIVSVKAQSMSDVAKAIGPMIGENTIVFTAMNGVPWWFLNGFGGEFSNRQLNTIDPTGEIAKAIPAKHIVGCVVHATCSTPEPGLVKHQFGNKLIIGEPSGVSSKRLSSLIELFTQAGYETVASNEVQKDVWFKLWGNMTVNPIAGMTGATTDKILDDDLVRGFISSIMLEAKEIGKRLGIEIDQNPEDRHLVTRKLGAFKPSMLQDVEAGKSIELDALVTVVAELGKITSVATPNTNILLGLSRLHAKTHGLYS